LEEYDLRNLSNESKNYSENVFEIHLLQLHEKALRNALLATGAIPPFVSGIDNLKNKVDGGLISPLPVHLMLNNKEKTQIKKVLMIANSETIIKHGIVKAIENNSKNLDYLNNLEIYYITPNERIPVSMWGYSETEEIKKTYEIGNLTFKTMI
jgi:predicted acylesterase/phospholipase RssA